MDKTLLRQAAILHPNKVMTPYAEMMEMDGFDAIYAFAETFGGLTVYVPSARTIFSRCLGEEAAKEYTGYNITNLSKKYGFSERGLKKLLGFK
ncbi:MAG: hypothetical protein FWB96_00595 [Defluviitaleaceae bacterium]|nr:hypothetical protein [Defluviitaleaceae bacterium]MCL2261788.1 hypothetical protein [Defluviitaleaceae bacterium]